MLQFWSFLPLPKRLEHVLLLLIDWDIRLKDVIKTNKQKNPIQLHNSYRTIRHF